MPARREASAREVEPSFGHQRSERVPLIRLLARPLRVGEHRRIALPADGDHGFDRVVVRNRERKNPK